ncbi:hypothetical protein ACLOJK_020990 [Asimina triloba]
MEDMKAKREMMKPILVKMGVAVGLTFSGFVISHFRQRRIGPRLPPQPRSPGSRRAGIKDEASLMPPLPAPATKEETPPAPQKAMENEVIGFSPANTKSADAEDFLLPELNELIQKDFESAGFSPTIKDMEITGPKRSDNEARVMEQENNNLRNVVRVLRERERSLEIQLLEYYGLQEQEAAVRELQNRLKISSMETQLLTIKIESLQAENRRLESQVADYSRVMTELDLAKARVMTELDLAKAKIKLMKRKIRSDSEQAKEQLAALHMRVAALKEHELKLAQSDADNQKKVERIKELEDELAELRKANSRLGDENSELGMKLESAQNVIFSIPSSPQARVLEEVEQLRNAKEELEKEVEKLRTDRCSDVEELVYLRWVNACLRYELRNYQPPPGKTVARDLSNSLSPRSEDKAKQLILEYANSGSAASEQEHQQSIIDFDLDYYSPSQSSTGDFDDSSLDPSCSTRHSNSSAKGKFFSKLKKIVLGKDGHGHSHSHSHKTRSAASEKKNSVSITSLDDLVRTSTTDSTSSCITAENAGSNRTSSDLRAFHDSSYVSRGLQSKTEEQQQNKLVIPYQDNHPNLPLEIHRLRNMSLEEMKEVINRDEERMSDDQVSSSPSRYKRTVLGEGHQSQHQHQQDHERSSSRKQDLVVKFAQALRSSRSSHKAQHRPTPSAHF